MGPALARRLHGPVQLRIQQLGVEREADGDPSHYRALSALSGVTPCGLP